MFVGQPSVCFNVLICTSMLLAMGAINRVVCNISFEHLMCIIKTILTKYYWSAIFKKIQSTFYTVFLIRMIGRIVDKSECKMNFSVKMLVTTPTGHSNSARYYTQDARYYTDRAFEQCRSKYCNKTYYKKLSFEQIFS